MDESPMKIATTCAGTAVLIANTVITIVSLLRPTWRRHLTAAAARCRRPGALLRALFAPKRVEDDFEECVAAEVNARLVQNMNDMAIAAGHVFILVLGRFTLKYVVGTERWTTVTQQWDLIIAGAAIAVMRAFPRVISVRTLPWWYGFLMLAMCHCIAVCEPSAGAYVVTSVFTAMPRYVLSMAYCKVSSVAVWSAAYFFSSAWTYFRIDAIKGPMGDFLVVELWVSVFLVAAVGQQQRAMWREARCKLETKRFCGERSAMTDLLTLICDAVVELDHELKITEHAPKLSAMLILSRKTRTGGMRLQQFMPAEEDRERFEEHLREHDASEGRGPPIASLSGAFHATLRDSSSSRLQVEIFFVRFYSVSGRRQYLVGIREFMDQPVAELKKFRSKELKDVEDQVAAATADANLVPQAGEDGDDVASLASSGSGGANAAAPPGAGTHLVLRQFLPTTVKAKSLTLCTAIAQWNFDVVSGACCPYHAAVRDARVVCEHMRRRRCKRQFVPDANVQCNSCGILDSIDDDNEGQPARCETCGKAEGMSVRGRRRSVMTSL